MKTVAKAHINRIGIAVPPHDVHEGFLAHARHMLGNLDRIRLFDRAARRSGISHRYSFLPVGSDVLTAVDGVRFYEHGNFPTTARRMERYAPDALALAGQAIDGLMLDRKMAGITHLIVASCTGFSAPGLDLQLAHRLGLSINVERQMIGFMGCSAAIPALRAAHHIIRSEPMARILVVNLELCTLHLQETDDLEAMLSFLLFGDGCAAALISSEESGIALEDFRSVIIPETANLITWQIGDQGFDMYLSGEVPKRISQSLRQEMGREGPDGLLRGEGTQAVDLWAVHAGGKSILDAVEHGLSLAADALDHSRAVLRDYGNMSSATIMFVLERMLRKPKLQASSLSRGMAMAFGPGMVAETARFSLAA
ncbi:MAG: type III polyketide synthase [Rhodospirillaceae bacterium]|nr:type III polyketide synthase [Rhodospirillaceae bacterium]